jgi:hypothetical protein
MYFTVYGEVRRGLGKLKAENGKLKTASWNFSFHLLVFSFPSQAPHPRRGSGKKRNLVTNLV